MFTPGVPADEDVGGEESGDTLEEPALDVSVHPELADVRALEHDRNRHPLRVVGFAGRGPELEGPLVEKGDPSPRDPWIFREHRDCRPEDVIRLVAAVYDSIERLEGPLAHASTSAPSNARTASRSSSGTRVGRRDSRSTRTSVCVAVTMRTSPGNR